MAYCYGPVYSRRLGFSLGIDLLPKKICSFNCIYCQAGLTFKKTNQRFQAVPLKALIREVKTILAKRKKLDYITLSGSGEPTLHKNLDKIIGALKKAASGVKVCVITNSSLLANAKLRRELLAADLIMPSLDAPNQQIFEKINQPVKQLKFSQIVKGLVALRKQYRGKIWLEIMLLAGYNDNLAAAYEFKRLIKLVQPDRVYLNLPQRPGVLSAASLLPTKQKVLEIKKILGKNCMVATYPKYPKKIIFKSVSENTILDSVQRRPQTKVQLELALGITAKKLTKQLNELLKRGCLVTKKINNEIYYLTR